MPRSILGRIKQIVPVKDFPIDDFELSFARSDVTVVSRGKAELDVALDTKARRVTPRNVSVYMVDASMNILLVGEDLWELLGISPHHLLEQKIASGEEEETFSYAGDSAYEFFNEEDDYISVGKSTDHELREALNNMVSQASDGLDSV